MFEYRNGLKLLVGENALSKIAYEMRYFNSSRAIVVVDEQGQRYLSAFLRSIAASDISVDIIEVSDHSLMADVDNAIAKFYAVRNNAIIGLGGEAAMEISKAISYSISHGLDRFKENVSTKRVVDNVPLLLVPTGLQGKSCGSRRLQLFDYNQKRVTMADIHMMPNAIILDPRMTKYVRESEVVENGTFGVFLCLAALLEDISPVARAYAVAGIEHARDQGYSNYNKKSLRNSQLTRRFSAMVCNVYAGIAIDEVENQILTGLAIELVEFCGVRYAQVFNALALEYMEICKFNTERKKILGLSELIGLDNALRLDPATRDNEIIGKVLDIFSQVGKDYKQKFRLGHFGIKQSDIKTIYENCVKKKFFEGGSALKTEVITLLKKAL